MHLRKASVVRASRSAGPAGWRLPVGVAVVRGASMHPTLRHGDRLLLWHGSAPRRGRLVVVRLPPGPDGPRPLAVKRATDRAARGAWWVESDNVGAGVDSWQVGAIPAGDVVGRVLCRLPRLPWPR